MWSLPHFGSFGVICSGGVGVHTRAIEPQEAALFLPLNQDDLMTGLRDRSSGLPNCHPSSSFALSTMTLCHTSLESLISSSTRNSISLLCYKASLT